MKKIAVFPGSFDPFTKGHEFIVEKALKIFDEIVIGIGHNVSKKYLFDLTKRKNHIRSIFKNRDNIKVTVFSGLTVTFCKTQKAEFIVRGLRDVKDFEYEKNIAQMNFELAQIESIFLMTDPKYTAVSSTIIREIYKSGGKVDAYVTNFEILV